MDNTTGSSAASGQRNPLWNREDFYAEITQITGEAGGDWKYLDGVACSGAGDDGPRQLLLLPLSGPQQGRPGSECSSDPTMLRDLD